MNPDEIIDQINDLIASHEGEQRDLLKALTAEYEHWERRLAEFDAQIGKLEAAGLDGISTTPPHPEVIEYVLKLIDQDEDEGEPAQPSKGTYREGIRLGILWATGKVNCHPLD